MNKFAFIVFSTLLITCGKESSDDSSKTASKKQVTLSGTLAYKSSSLTLKNTLASALPCGDNCQIKCLALNEENSAVASKVNGGTFSLDFKENRTNQQVLISDADEFL